MQFQIDYFMTGVVAGSIIIGIFLAYHSVFHVDEGHRAVVLRWGALNNPSRCYFSGVHFKWPFEKVFMFSTMEKTIDISGSKNGLEVLLQDGTVARVDSKIRIQPLAEQYYQYVFKMARPLEHIKQLFVCLLRNEVASHNVNGELGVFFDLRRNRELLNQRMDKVCRGDDATWDASSLILQYGIQFNAVDLTDLVPAQELEQSLNSIQTALSQAETMYSHAEADSMQKLASAKKSIEIAKLKAQSVKTELLTIAREIEPLAEQGQIQHFFWHRHVELTNASKLSIVQDGEITC